MTTQATRHVDPPRDRRRRAARAGVPGSSPRTSTASSRASTTCWRRHRRVGVRAARRRPHLRPRRRRQRVPSGPASSPSSRRTGSCSPGTSTRCGRSRAISSKTSEVEVRFIADGPNRTRVELEHRNLDRHGDGWEGLRAGVDSEDGWPHLSSTARCDGPEAPASLALAAAPRRRSRPRAARTPPVAPQVRRRAWTRESPTASWARRPPRSNWGLSASVSTPCAPR